MIYLFANHQGTPELGRTGNGTWKYRDHYTPYGEHYSKEHATSRNNPGFTGHVEDYQTGLTYMQVRYYDPALGRFLSNDPVGFADSGFDPAYFNRYAYTANDPVNATDPTGMYLESGIEIASIGVGLHSLVGNLRSGNLGAAALDVGGIALDGAALAVPVVPAVLAWGSKQLEKAARNFRNERRRAKRSVRPEFRLASRRRARLAAERPTEQKLVVNRHLKRQNRAAERKISQFKCREIRLGLMLVNRKLKPGT